MLGIFKNRKKEMETEKDIKEAAKNATDKAIDELDELLDEIVKGLVNGDKSLTTIMKLKFHGYDQGLKVEVGGSRIAGDAFKDLGEGYAKLYDDLSEKLSEVAKWVNDRMVELGCESKQEV